MIPLIEVFTNDRLENVMMRCVNSCRAARSRKAAGRTGFPQHVGGVTAAVARQINRQQNATGARASSAAAQTRGMAVQITARLWLYRPGAIDQQSHRGAVSSRRMISTKAKASLPMTSVSIFQRARDAWRILVKSAPGSARVITCNVTLRASARSAEFQFPDGA